MLRNLPHGLRSVVLLRRGVRQLSEGPVVETREGCVFVDSVFPIQLGRFDIRRYIGLLREEGLVQSLRDRLSSVNAHGFRITSLEPHPKDGGVFIRFAYKADSENALETIEQELKRKVHDHGGPPSWLGLGSGNVWLVKGIPWNEDMYHFASPIVKVAFEGPDIHQESLYKLLRPYGRIKDMTDPIPVPAGSTRFSTVSFQKIRSCCNCAKYPIRVHAVRDWLSGHPRIVLPVVVFLLGTLTYTIFDPLRSLMIQGKVEDWFDVQEFKFYQWLRKHTLDRLYSVSKVSPFTANDGWKERKEAEAAVRAYLAELPTTITFVHGPQGSGKSTMLQTVLNDTDRKSLTIDCGSLLQSSSDALLVRGLAKQTGYWPFFSFLNSVNHLLDLASMGLIGQKAGMSTSLVEQLQSILDVTENALKNIGSSHRRTLHKQTRLAEKERLKAAEEEAALRRKQGNGSLDGTAESGVKSELGTPKKKLSKKRKAQSAEDIEAVESLPIVIIKNFERGPGYGDELLSALAKWAARLSEHQIAHVIVVSDNRENMKSLTKALPSKPLNLIALDDADTASALAFVKHKLKDADIDLQFSYVQTTYLERLGGRSSDLETLIHKVRNGQQIEEAVEDIINRGVGEIQKSAFGDDEDDAKRLPWTREQAWMVVKKLASQPEISYSEVLLDFPFKSDETPLRNMEHAELISIGTHLGRPSTIKPGKPIFKWVFQRLEKDAIFQATQDLAFNEKVIATAETSIKAYEQELSTLKDMGADTSFWSNLGSSSVLSQRAKYLLNKAKAAQTKVETLEKQNLLLKKTLSQRT
ncbi:RNA12 protein-domain-containing protein [Desarmillaria tabescens]|uniref:Mitochondrial escape protein 2 n=1 Tax=Armillaria tabescens TaxID=1929756 RepID=A0AA39MW90_ARMTA|nr:RNA12 protein-domain-containing protein [Desarmillaria tabescens]KAK0448384.1 RNA12 protein-domain-containing protein [Desarmillaria tabescens]